jgi:hypothetical protein
VDRDGQGPHAGGVVRADVVGVEGLAEEDLAGEGAGGPFGDDHVGAAGRVQPGRRRTIGEHPKGAGRGGPKVQETLAGLSKPREVTRYHLGAEYLDNRRAMTGPDHYRAADRLLEEAESGEESSPRALWCLELAKLHTAVAQVAATTLNSDGREWAEVAGRKISV